MFPEPLFHVGPYGVTLYPICRYGSALPALALGLYLARSRGTSFKRILDTWMVGMAMLMAVSIVKFSLGLYFPLHGIFMELILPLVLSIALFLYIRPDTRGDVMARLDPVLPALALAQVIIRVGCFSAGCCHGVPAWGLPWAVVFSHPQTACIYRGIPVHPTQLYLLFGNLFILLLLLRLFRMPAFRGVLLWVYLLAYGMLRFVVEFYRGDPRPMVGPLSIHQLVCLGFILVGGAMLARRFARVGRLEAFAG